MPLLSTLRGLHVVCPGEIPAELGSLSNLTQLDLYGNDLSGCVPSSLQNHIDLSPGHYSFDDLPYC